MGRIYHAGARGRRRTGKLLGVTYELFEAGQKVKSFITEVDCLETAFTESMGGLDEDSIATVVGLDDHGGVEDGVEQVGA